MKLIRVEPAEVIVSLEFAELEWLASVPRLVEDYAIPDQDQVKLRLSATLWEALAALAAAQQSVEVLHERE